MMKEGDRFAEIFYLVIDCFYHGIHRYDGMSLLNYAQKGAGVVSKSFIFIGNGNGFL